MTSSWLSELISIGLDNVNVSDIQIRIITNSKVAAYYHLEESYRDQGKVKQRTLLSLGRVEDEKLEQLAEAISKYTDKISVFNMAKDVDVNDTYILGPLLVLDRMMTELGLSGCLSMLQSKHKKLQFDLKKVIFTQLCSRFVKPVSKLSLYDNWLGRMYPGLVEHDTAIHHLYRSLDLLCEHWQLLESFRPYFHAVAVPFINIPFIIYLSHKSKLPVTWTIKRPPIHFILLMLIRLLIQPLIIPGEYFGHLLAGRIKLFCLL